MSFKVATSMMTIGLGFLSAGALAATTVDSPTLTIAPGDGLSYTAGSVHITSMRISPCGGGALVDYPVDITYDLLEGDELTMPAVCAEKVRLTVDSLCVAGDGSAGGTFDVCLEPGFVRPLMPADLSFTGSQALTLELGATDWITEASLGISAGGSVVIDSESPEHDGLVQVVAAQTSFQL